MGTHDLQPGPIHRFQHAKGRQVWTRIRARNTANFIAILISIVIAKPLELKVFDKEIQPELIVMEQEAYARQEAQLRTRFTPTIDSLKSVVQFLKTEITLKAGKRDELRRLAQEEADGTGGSRRRNLGPIYKVKKADADAAELELLQLAGENQLRISAL